MARPRGTRKQREQAARMTTGAGRMIGYVRVSTAGQEQNGHSLDGQRTRLQEAAKREGFELVGILHDVESGAKQRDGLDAAWERVKVGQAEGIAFLRLDRLGRSLAALAGLVQEARDLGASLYAVEGGWQLRQGQDVNGALPVLMGVAEMERAMISRRTKEGLAAARAKGVKLGRKPENGGEVATLAAQWRREGLTIAAVADRLTAEGHRTARGCTFSTSAVYRLIRREDPAALPVGGFAGTGRRRATG